MSLSEAGMQSDGCTLYLVLNEQPFQGRKLYAKSPLGQIRTLFVTESFRIEVPPNRAQRS